MFVSYDYETFAGRAFAVVRSEGAGKVKATVCGDGCGSDCEEWKSDPDRLYLYCPNDRIDGGVLMQCVASSDRPEGTITDPKPIVGTEYPSCVDYQ